MIVAVFDIGPECVWPGSADEAVVVREMLATIAQRSELGRQLGDATPEEQPKFDATHEAGLIALAVMEVLGGDSYGVRPSFGESELVAVLPLPAKVLLRMEYGLGGVGCWVCALFAQSGTSIGQWITGETPRDQIVADIATACFAASPDEEPRSRREGGVMTDLELTEGVA
jgi:hypothetical protein